MRPVYDRIYKHLFENSDANKLTKADYQVKERVQAAFIKKLDQPTIRDKSLIKYLMENFGISMSLAYEDLNAAERIHGNVRKANKEYVRMLVTETLKEVIDIERKRIVEDMRAEEKKENGVKGGTYPTKDLIVALGKMIHAHNLDKEDPNLPNWSELQPPIIEPTDDVTILDLEMITDEGVQKLRQQYLGASEKAKYDG